MPSASDVKAGGAYVELSADMTKLQRGLANAKAHVDRFGNKLRSIGMQVGALGAVMAAPFVSAVRHFTTAGDAIAKTARRIGLSATAVAEFQHVAEISGASMGAFEKGVRGMQRALFDASRGSSEIVDAFKAIGLTSQQLHGLKPEEQFQMIAGAVGNLQDASLKSAVAMKVFGRSGAELIPIFDLGADGIKNLRERAVLLQGEFSGPMAKSAEDLTDQFTDLSFSFRGVQNAIASAIAPALGEIVTKLTAGVVVARQWIGQNRELVVMAAKAAAAVSAFGAALLALWGVTKVISALLAVFGSLIGVLKVVMAVGFALSKVLLLAFSPLGLAITGAIAMLVILADNMGGLSNVIRIATEQWSTWFGMAFDFLREIAGGSIDWLTDKISTAADFWREKFGGAFDWLSEKVGVAADYWREKLGYAADKVGAAAGAIGDKAGDVGSALGLDQLPGMATKTFDKIKAGIAEFKKSAGEGIQSALGSEELKKRFDEVLAKLRESMAAVESSLAGAGPVELGVAAAGTQGVAGTFSGAIAERITYRNDTVQRQQLEVQREIADNTESIASQISRMTATYASG